MKSLLHTIAIAATAAFLLNPAPGRADAPRYSAAGLFNQANAEQRAGHLGPAILHYERARLLAPHDAAIAQNLHTARERSGVGQSAVPAWRRSISSISINALAILVSICLLLLCVLLLGTRFLATTIRGLSTRLAIGLGAVALLCSSAIAVRWPELERSVVQPDHATARLAPARDSDGVFELKGGELVSVGGEYGSFVRVCTPEGRAGWVGKSELAPSSLRRRSFSRCNIQEQYPHFSTSTFSFSAMKLPQKPLCTAFVIGTLLVASVTAYALRAAHTLDAKETEAAVTALTTNLLETSQFAHHPLDQTLVDTFLDRYLDSLDGGRVLFLQGDADEFGKYRSQLAQGLRQQGDDGPAFAIFARYLERLQQRDDFVNAALTKGPFDFTSDEHFAYERKAAPRPIDLAAAKALWLQQLRSDYLQEKLAGKKPDEITRTLSRRADRMVQSMRKLSPDSILEIYLEALAHVYDPHSDYMGHEQMQSFQTVMNLSLAGIGASLTAEDGYCKIRELIPGGPAARGGQLKVGDRLVGVAQQSEKEFTDLVDLPLPQAVDLIRGKKGTSVRLSVIPAGAADGAARKTITIVRDEVKLEDQQAKASLVDLPSEHGGTQRMGVIDLPGFYAGEGGGSRTSASADVARLLHKLERDNVQGIILDLRRNGGGSLDEAIKLTGLFISGGPVVQTRDLAGKVEVGRAPSDLQIYKGPLVVLISRFSASASEIVAGALQDYGRAVIVGDSSTFGKGTVQTIIPLDRVMEREDLVPSEDPGALKVTISKFYRPSGQSTQLKGVRSDVVLPSPSDTPEIGESELLNPLPWDTIPAASGLERDDRVSAFVGDLRDRSAKRIHHDPDFAALEKDIDRDRTLRASKSVSLNEAERRKEKEENEARSKALKAARLARAGSPPPTWQLTLRNVDQSGLGEPVKATAAKPPSLALSEPVNGETDEPSPTDDLLLTETEHILGDYIALLHAPVVTRR